MSYDIRYHKKKPFDIFPLAPSLSYRWASDQLRLQGLQANISEAVLAEVSLRDYRCKHSVQTKTVN